MKDNEDSLHILLLTSWFPNENEPFLGNFIEQFAYAMSSRHRVTLMYLDYSSSIKYGVKSKILNPNLTICRACVPARKGVFYKYLAHKMSLQWIKENCPDLDLIHAQVGIRDWWHFISIKKTLKLPLVYTEHGSYFIGYQFDRLPFLKRLGLRRLMKKSQEIVAVSDVLAQSMMQNVEQKVEVIGNFIPNSWFDFSFSQLSNEKYRFLHISTLDANKNFQGVLDACAILKEKNILNWHFTVVSEEDFSAFEKWTQMNELVEHFTFLSHVPHELLPELYLTHDCFVLNSNKETFSIVNAEALCMGLHLITTPVGFVGSEKNEVYDLVAFNSPQDLAEKMKNSLQLKKRNNALGREFVAKFREDRVLDSYDQLYQTVIKEAKTL